MDVFARCWPKIVASIRQKLLDARSNFLITKSFLYDIKLFFLFILEKFPKEDLGHVDDDDDDDEENEILGIVVKLALQIPLNHLPVVLEDKVKKLAMV